MTNKKKSNNQSGDWQKEDEIVQAVIIADSFNRKFAPITFETPRVWISFQLCFIYITYTSQNFAFIF